MTNKTMNPFADVDIAKMMGEFRIPGLDMDAMMASQRRNIEALTAANQLALEGAQAVMRRQSEIMRQMMDEARSMMTELMGSGAPEDKVAKQADMVKVSFEKALANMKEITELVAKSQGEAAEKLAHRVSEVMDEMKTTMAKMKK